MCSGKRTDEEMSSGSASSISSVMVHAVFEFKKKEPVRNWEGSCILPPLEARSWNVHCTYMTGR